jgi:hypothetical protein
MPELTYKLGLCVLCGDRVHSDDQFIKTSDGYCHRDCISNKSAIKA